MPNILKLTAENADELLNASAYGAGAVIQVQNDTTEAFGAPSDTGTVALVSGTRAYTFYHTAGISSTWYRTRYENAAGTTTSDWSAAFQTGDETAGMLCSIYDVTQRLFGTATPSSDATETLIEIIRNVSNEIEDYCGRWLAPRPTNPATDMVLRFDVPWTTRSLSLTYGGLYVGIRRVTSINVASQSQPSTGGTYTVGTVADYLIRPQSVAGSAGVRLDVTDAPTGQPYFFRGYNTVEITGGFGPSAVPGWCQEVAIAKVTRRFIGKETATTAIALGPDGGVRLLAGLPPDLAATLQSHRFVPVG